MPVQTGDPGKGKKRGSLQLPAALDAQEQEAATRSCLGAQKARIGLGAEGENARGFRLENVVRVKVTRFRVEGVGFPRCTGARGCHQILLGRSEGSHWAWCAK